MDTLKTIITVIITILGILNVHTTILFVIGLISKPKIFPETTIKKKYGVIIPARNESRVIGNLIESIHQQTYDQSLIDIFVIADNCTDNTATIARELGCRVYERFDTTKVRKGYALEFLFNHIQRDFGITSFDGYFIFDADNLLQPQFIYEMNKAFVENKNIVTSYRNTKNFETNIISSAYGIHFYSRTVYNHRPRQKINSGTHLSGTGFVISSHLIKDGWRYHTLTEDSELTMCISAENIKIGYCEAAVHYDEQPTNFSTALRQRIRWTRGRLIVFLKTCKRLFLGIFKHKSFTNYDLLMYIFPYSLVTFVLNLIYAVAGIIISIFVLKNFNWGEILYAFMMYWVGGYLGNLLIGILVAIRERKQIKCHPFKTFLYVLTWPWFNLIGIFVFMFAIFIDVKWTPIIHDDARKISDLIEPEKSAA